ncbi:HAD family hydrolase [Sphingomonas sp. 1185]|uniref:HAD family hydrolase n=1 Tax=Sphingomonas sp. 1185 TaxID=3156411 RepID=UPI0033907DDF
MTAAILFDLDETLLDRTTSLIAFLADQHSRFRSRLGYAAFEAWRDRFIAMDARGHTHKSVVYPAILAEFNGDPNAADELLDDYRKRCSSFARPFAGMAETLQELRSRGRRLGIITNGETAFQSRHIEALGLDRMVDAVLISQTEGLRKPDPALFERAAARLCVQASECLFVGDNPVADVLGAHNAGLSTAWFRCGMDWPADLPPPPGAVIERLSEVLALVDGVSSVR